MKAVTKFSQDTFGFGDDNLTKVPVDVLNQADAFVAPYDSLDVAPWFDFNARARLLGLYTRKDTEGDIYFAIPLKDLEVA